MPEGSYPQLTGKFLSVCALTYIPHLSVVTRIGDRYVVADGRNVFEQMLHVGHSGLWRQTLNNMLCRLPNDSAVVATALRLGTERSRGLSKNISRYSLGGGK